MTRKACILALICCVSLSVGCTSMQGVQKLEVQTESTFIQMPPRKLGTVSRLPEKKQYSDTVTPASLETANYVKLGRIELNYLIKGCIKGDCRKYLGQVDATERLLKVAAEHGGTLVMLTDDNRPAQYMISKSGNKCLKVEKFGARNYIKNPYQPIVEYDYCSQWETLSGMGDWVRSAGDVWRFDPELAQRIKQAAKTMVLDIERRYLTEDPDTGERISGKDCCRYVRPILGHPLSRWFDYCGVFDAGRGGRIQDIRAHASRRTLEYEEVNGKYTSTLYDVWYAVDYLGNAKVEKKERITY